MSLVIPSLSAGTAQLLGTVHPHRWRWSPFDPTNAMARQGLVFRRRLRLSRSGGRHGDGVYAVRFTVESDCHQTYAFDLGSLDERGWPRLLPPERSDFGHNLMLVVEADGEYEFCFDPAALRYDITPQPRILREIESMQLNGFVWDEEADGEKFDETRPGHQMRRDGAWWEIDVPLHSRGGLPRRRDGVYQFLFSCNRNHDFGLGGLNTAPGRLAGGTGFGSSRGTSRHSALTIAVVADGRYRFRANPSLFAWEVVPLDGQPAPRLLNTMGSMQLLGTIYQDRPYDPTDPDKEMARDAAGRYRKQVQVAAGTYAVNFAMSGELFLDTMGCGAWYADAGSRSLAGKAWHGKPDEPNVLVQVLRDARLEFVYDPRSDAFSISPADVVDEPVLAAASSIDSLQLVGSFDAPLEAWQPAAAANDMEREGPERFRKRVDLQAGRTYQYKYSANRWGWLWVFADYEYDGYARLTSHGDPAPMAYTAQRSGPHDFLADLRSGEYSVVPVP